MDELKDYLTTPEAAEALGVTRQRVLAMIKHGGLFKYSTFSEKLGMYLVHKSGIEAVKDRKPGRPKGQTEKVEKPKTGRKRRKADGK